MTWESLASRYHGRRTVNDEGLYLVTYARGDKRYLYVYLSHDLCDRTGFEIGDKVDMLLNREELRCRIEAVENGGRGWTLVSDYARKARPKKRMRFARIPGVHFSIPIKEGMWETPTATREHTGRTLWIPQKIKEASAGAIEFELNRTKGKFVK